MPQSQVPACSSFSVARRAPAIKLRNLTPATGGRRRAVVASGVLCCTAYPNIRLVVASRITGSGAHVDCPGVAWAAVGQSFRRLGAYRWWRLDVYVQSIMPNPSFLFKKSLKSIELYIAWVKQAELYESKFYIIILFYYVCFNFKHNVISLK